MNQKLDFESPVHHKINQLLSIVDTFKGTWNALEQTKSGYLKELRKIATIESIGSSTRIEGAALTDEEVEKLLRSFTSSPRLWAGEDVNTSKNNTWLQSSCTLTNTVCS